jgi:hypothetical protein
MRDSTMSNASQFEQTDQPPPTICGQCGQPMRSIGKLPRRGAKAALEIFRCYGCDNVLSQPK